jgi:hypothetical protein
MTTTLTCKLVLLIIYTPPPPPLISKLNYLSLLFLFALLLPSCGAGVNGSSNIKSFYNKLQGTWKSNDPSIYSSTLVISYDRIIITKYGESQTTDGKYEIAKFL